MKRGRPTAAAARYGQAFSDSLRSGYEDKTTRTHAANFYRAAAYSLLISEAASDIPHLELIFQCVTDSNGRSGIKQKCEIMEQLGRMIEQDHYTDTDVLTVAKIAAEAYYRGCTVKQIKAYIVHGRTTGEW